MAIRLRRIISSASDARTITLSTSPDDPALDAIVRRGLRDLAGELDRSEPGRPSNCGCAARPGVFRWFLPRALGWLEWSDVDVIRGYLRLSAACLTTTFIITQRTGACQRIAGSDNALAKERLLPDWSRASRSPRSASRT